MASSIPLSLNPPLFHRPHIPHLLITTLTPFPISKPSSQYSLTKPHLCFSSPPSNHDREEIRWLREEQRWLREESRWSSERDSLLRQISDLQLRIQTLERQNSIQGANVTAMLQALKEIDLRSPKVNRIAESGTSAVPMVLEEVKEMVVEEVRVSEREGEVEKKKKTKKKVATLRKGSEGEAVRAMQEALQKLGFYSGEEDMEYSSFSSGTERAVKTWQATLGALEDGIMTAELLERLYVEQQIEGSGSSKNAGPKGNGATVPHEGDTNGAAVASVKEISEIQQIVVNKKVVTEAEASEHRVFLLGENRWEEPSRLIGRDKQVGGSKSRDATTKCLACRGEGRLLCSECDGTGEPNIEPQFLEWVDEEGKCPYCEGLGYSICDVCEGKAMI